MSGGSNSQKFSQIVSVVPTPRNLSVEVSVGSVKIVTVHSYNHAVFLVSPRLASAPNSVPALAGVLCKWSLRTFLLRGRCKKYISTLQKRSYGDSYECWEQYNKRH